MDKVKLKNQILACTYLITYKSNGHRITKNMMEKNPFEGHPDKRKLLIQALNLKSMEHLLNLIG